MWSTKPGPIQTVHDGFAWQAAGAGDPVLLLHGIPDNGHAWDGVMARLAGRCRCLAPDLPGFGSSAKAHRPAGLDELREIIDGIALRLALPDRFSLVVHDVGGLFGLAWAVARPERIQSLVILNTSIFPDRRWHWGARIVRTPVIGELAMAALPRLGFRAEVRRASNHNLSDATIDATLRTFGPAARRVALDLYRLQTPAVLRELPEAVLALTSSVPTRVVWGACDPYLPASFAHRFGAREVLILPEIGHWPHREAPGQVAAAIDQLLTSALGAA